jgi:hypothetical protein
MHDCESFEKLRDYIRNEGGGCRRCPKCYRAGVNALFFDTSRTTVIMLISESPYNFPERAVKRSEDFVRHVLQPRLETYPRSDVLKSESKPRDIFEFIYNTFKPIFDAKPKKNWADAFLSAVYWTHVGKKTFKSYSTQQRTKYGRQCARQLLLQELQVIRPTIVIIASAIASRILLGSGFQELLARENSRYLSDGSFLRLQDECRRDSLLDESVRRGDFPSGSPCKLAIFPNPSPNASKWKKLAYQKHGEAMIWKIKEIHETLRSQISRDHEQNR